MKVVHTIILFLLSLQIAFGQVTISGTAHDRRGESLFENGYIHELNRL